MKRIKQYLCDHSFYSIEDRSDLGSTKWEVVREWKCQLCQRNYLFHYGKGILESSIDKTEETFMNELAMERKLKELNHLWILRITGFIIGVFIVWAYIWKWL